MIEFNELRISPDNKNLIIEASVPNLDYYDDVYIDSVIIDTQDTYIQDGPSSNPVFSHIIDYNQDKVYIINECSKYSRVETNDGEVYANSGSIKEKKIRLVLDSDTLGISLNGNLFFVYIITSGKPSADTPCGMLNNITLGVTADLYPFYRNMLCSMKEIENNCNIPKHFIDNILRFKALELSIKTGHYIQAIKYWKKFFMNLDNNSKDKCSCYG